MQNRYYFCTNNTWNEVQGPSSLGTTCQFYLEIQNLRFPNLLNQKLHFKGSWRHWYALPPLIEFQLSAVFHYQPGVHFAKYVPHEMIEVTPFTCPVFALSVWWSMLMSLCSWWKCGSYLNVLEKETEVRTTMPASDLDHSLVLLGFTMFDCISPTLLVLGSWTRTCIQITSWWSTLHPLITHWVSNGIDQTEAFGLLSRSQSKRSPMSGPGPWPCQHWPTNWACYCDAPCQVMST